MRLCQIFLPLLLSSYGWMTTTYAFSTVSLRSVSLPRFRSDSSSRRSSSSNNRDEDYGDSMDIQKQILAEMKEFQICSQLWIETYSRIFFPKDKSKKIDPKDIVQVCDDLDDIIINEGLWTSRTIQLRQRTLEHRRYEWLTTLLQEDYQAYINTAGFLSPTKIPRRQLPNVQDVPYAKDIPIGSKQFNFEGQLVVEDCSLDDMRYQESWLDQLLLQIFRTLVTKYTGGVTSSQKGILGLVDQGRQFLLQPGQTPEAQHTMVKSTLGGLMTPVLPPFYRIFMGGQIPRIEKQLGPWFYAPYLTSVVTPTFFGFLVGPSYPNRRKDGQLGGLVVEKCKFLQESGCKGLCLHQCKLPAQQFFQEELGLSLTVSPNFVTQECQWSFGEIPLPPADDPSFPQGCLVGCNSRKAIRESGSKADVCN